MKTGVFFHPLLSTEDWPIIGNKFMNFPKILKEIIKRPNIELFEDTSVEESLLYEVHTKDYIEDVKKRWYYQAAKLVVGGCVKAAEMVFTGKLKNALVFSVAAGHHAGPSSGWGGTYLSCTGPMVHNLRKKYKILRFAILDTDCHHGDGTRAMFKGDPNVLHVCFCNFNTVDEEETKIDIDVGWQSSDIKYLELVEKEFSKRVKWFKPAMIIHNFGHDTSVGDYGDKGLTPAFFPYLASYIKELAEEVSDGKYIIITHGGARRDVAEKIFPEIIKILAE